MCSVTYAGKISFGRSYIYVFRNSLEVMHSMMHYPSQETEILILASTLSLSVVLKEFCNVFEPVFQCNIKGLG